MNEIIKARKYSEKLRNSMKKLLDSIGIVSIGKDDQFPYGWRKAAKG